MTCGSLEIDILNSVWTLTDNGQGRDISIQDVVDHLTSRGIVRAYTTIKTVMDRLTTKCILVRYRVGKKFYYKNAMSQEDLATSAVDEVIAKFFGGNATNLIRFVESNYNVLVK